MRTGRRARVDVRGTAPRARGVVGRRDDAERAVGKPARELDEEREVTARVGADRDDVVIDDGIRSGRKMLGVDAERDELDPRPASPSQCPKLLDLTPAIRDDRVRRPERIVEEAPREAPLGAARAARGGRSPRTRPAASRGRAGRGARAGCRPCRRWRRRRRQRFSASSDASTRAKSPEYPPPSAHGAVEEARFGARACSSARTRGSRSCRTSKPPRASSSSPYRLYRDGSHRCAQRLPAERGVAIEDEGCWRGGHGRER